MRSCELKLFDFLLRVSGDLHGFPPPMSVRSTGARNNLKLYLLEQYLRQLTESIASLVKLESLCILHLNCNFWLCKSVSSAVYVGLLMIVMQEPDGRTL